MERTCNKRKKKVFIHSSDPFPYGGAQTNYIQNLALVCKEAGYLPVVVVRPNEEYIDAHRTSYYMGMEVRPITASENRELHTRQSMNGFSEERIQAMIESGIDVGDVVIAFQLGYNINFHSNLQNFCKKIGVKSIVGVLEYWDAEDFKIKEQYENFRHMADEVYLEYDGILVMSKRIDNYYKGKGKLTFLMPPFIEYRQGEGIKKKDDKYSFAIISSKDSFQSMLMAFASLEEAELNNIELHVCGVKEEHIKEIINNSEYNQLIAHMVIHSWMEYEELLALYEQMHFLVIARNVCQRTLANFPSKVPETMAYGVVPIVSDVGEYTKYYLQDGIDSIFIDGDSVEAIVKSIRKALALDADEFERYSYHARKCAEEKFDYHVWTEQVRAMLES